MAVKGQQAERGVSRSRRRRHEPSEARQATRRSGVLEAAARCPADAKEQLPGNGRLVAFAWSKPWRPKDGRLATLAVGPGTRRISCHKAIRKPCSLRAEPVFWAFLVISHSIFSVHFSRHSYLRVYLLWILILFSFDFFFTKYFLRKLLY